MQKYQVIFVVGSPGSGKDVIIRDIVSNYNIVEFASSQIDEMLSDDGAFKRAKYEKRNSILERNSILVTANSFDLGFVITKSVLGSVGYTPHLIFVEANLSVAYERLLNRTNLKESLERISIGNANKFPILELFDSSVVVDNSENLDLTGPREYVAGILDELCFKTELTLEKIVNVGLRDKINKIGKFDKPNCVGKIPGRDMVALPIIDSYISKTKKKVSTPKIPGSFIDGTCDQQPNIALGEWEEWPTGGIILRDPGQQPSAPVTNLGSDQQKTNKLT